MPLDFIQPLKYSVFCLAYLFAGWQVMILMKTTKDRRLVMVKIKLLTVKQPFAYLLCKHGAKENETRGHKTNFRGTLYIHAGKTFFFNDLTILKTNPHFKKWIPDPPKQIEYSAIIGKVDIVDCVPTEYLAHKISAQELAFGDYMPGRYAWVCENHTLFENPIIRISGKQGLWEMEMEEEYAQANC